MASAPHAPIALLSFPDLAAAETYRQLTAHVTMTAPPRLFLRAEMLPQLGVRFSLAPPAVVEKFPILPGVELPLTVAAPSPPDLRL